MLIEQLQLWWAEHTSFRKHWKVLSTPHVIFSYLSTKETTNYYLKHQLYLINCDAFKKTFYLISEQVIVRASWLVTRKKSRAAFCLNYHFNTHNWIIHRLISCCSNKSWFVVPQFCNAVCMKLFLLPCHYHPLWWESDAEGPQRCCSPRGRVSQQDTELKPRRRWRIFQIVLNSVPPHGCPALSVLMKLRVTTSSKLHTSFHVCFLISIRCRDGL